MDRLSLALFYEGDTDARFLPPVITRTTRNILHKYKRDDIKVPPLLLIKDNKTKRDVAILQAAQAARECHALIIHADADDADASNARCQRFDPGANLARQAEKALCRELLPIIPIQAIEAWMMADYQLLIEEVGTSMSAQEFGIPDKARQVEKIAKPKERLLEAVRRAYKSRSKRRRDINIDFLYEPLGEYISLDRLNHVPSYQQFVQDLTTTLQTLNILQ